MSKSYRNALLCGTTLALAGMLASTQAQAQAVPRPGQLEEIVITAQKRTENVQKASIAVDVLKPSDLAKTGVTTVAQLQQVLPTVKIVPSPIFNISIRGLGTSDYNPGVDSDVAYSLDGIYLSSPVAMTPVLFDLSRVEAVLGPQGTLYGRNSNAGVINFISNEPNFKYGGHASVGFGNYGAVNSEAAVNIPLSDTLALRVSEGSTKHNPYDSDGQNAEDSVAGRAKLLYQPNSNFTALLTLDAGHRGMASRSYDGVCPPGINLPACAGVPFAKWSGFQPGPQGEYNNIDSFGASLALHYDLGWANLTSLTGYRRFSWNSDTMSAWWANVPNLNTIVNERDSFITQEVRLASDPGSFVTWVGGVYYSSDTDSATESLDYVANQSYAFLDNIYQTFPENIKGQSEAVFGEATIPMPSFDSLKLRLGARYTHETKSEQGSVVYGTLSTGAITQGPFLTNASQSIGRFTWKAGLDYDITPANKVYFTASTGFKSGGLNDVPPQVSALAIFKPEFITAEEIGSKNRFLEGRLQINADLFHYDYRNYQTYLLWHVTSVPLVGDTLLPTLNSQKATFQGAEIDAKWRVTPDDTLGLSFNFLDDTFNQFLVPLPGAAVPFNISGSQVFLAPRTTFSPSFEHVFELNNGDALSIGGDSQVVASQIAQGNYTLNGSPNNLYRQPAYHKTGVNVTYHTADSGWTITAYIRNIENAAVVTSIAGGYPSPQDIALVNYRLDVPRTFGFSVRKDF